MASRTPLRCFAAPLLALAGVACSDGGATPGSGNSGDLPPVDAAPVEVLDLEDEAAALINAERTARSIAALHHDDLLRAVARAHSQDMVARSYFAHINPDGDSPFDRMAAVGISFQRAGENIAWNRGYADPAMVAVDGWMNSDGHRANILDDRFTTTGMGAAESSNGGWYFTQVFTRPSGDLVLRSWWSRSDGDAGGWSAESR